MLPANAQASARVAVAAASPGTLASFNLGVSNASSQRGLPVSTAALVEASPDTTISRSIMKVVSMGRCTIVIRAAWLAAS